MKIRQKQVAAALAAVDLYLEEEAAAAFATLAARAPAVPARVIADPGAWAQAGRLDAMGMRRLMQLRAFARVR
ncbi:hypothetical protein AGMMS50256_17900 [Betaproteobacteria bacterium]|nr:hypothetical protein AGMMS50256_17900 [Betaproteobacteria bacterium]